MKNALKIWLLPALLVVGTGCGQKIKFAGGESPLSQSSADPICRSDEVTVAKPTKFILVVDQSGSNVNGPYEHPGLASDPQKALRYGAISEFHALHGAKAHMEWSFIAFQGVTAHALTNNGDLQTPVFVNGGGMATALEAFRTSTDEGNTPYLAALQMVRNLIANDLGGNNPADTQYRIVFLTDGYPTESVTGQQLEDAIDQAVKDIVDLAPAAIQLSTIYYGLPDPTASTRLARMASQGQGEFLDSVNSNGLHLGDVIQVPKTTCE
jgi:hypothetical protein